MLNVPRVFVGEVPGPAVQVVWVELGGPGRGGRGGLGRGRRGSRDQGRGGAVRDRLVLGERAYG